MTVGQFMCAGGLSSPNDEAFTTSFMNTYTAKSLQLPFYAVLGATLTQQFQQQQRVMHIANKSPIAMWLALYTRLNRRMLNCTGLTPPPHVCREWRCECCCLGAQATMTTRTAAQMWTPTAAARASCSTPPCIRCARQMCFTQPELGAVTASACRALLVGPCTRTLLAQLWKAERPVSVGLRGCRLSKPHIFSQLVCSSCPGSWAVRWRAGTGAGTASAPMSACWRGAGSTYSSLTPTPSCASTTTRSGPTPQVPRTCCQARTWRLPACKVAALQGWAKGHAAMYGP